MSDSTIGASAYAGPPPLVPGEPFDVPLLPPLPASAFEDWRPMPALPVVTEARVVEMIDAAIKAALADPKAVAAALLQMSPAQRQAIRVLLDGLEACGVGE